MPAPRLCFLSFDNPGEYVIDDDLAIPLLNSRGFSVESAAWQRTDVDWRAFDAVIIRSTWDYHHDPDRFLAVLAEIEACGTPLLNPRRIVEWNSRKTYLRDLFDRGVPIVPTIWRDALASGELASLYAQVGAPEIVVKPVVGANANGAFRLDARGVVDRAADVEAFYANRALMAQPFVSSVATEGEFSLFYFNGTFSHAIVKRPASGDFRVQEEHGGAIDTLTPDVRLRASGDKAIRAIGETLLYARADFVRGNGGEHLLMELELIEPSLYLRMDADAPERFARAIAEAPIFY